MTPGLKMALACATAGAGSTLAMLAAVWSFFTNTWGPVLAGIGCLAVVSVALAVARRIERQQHAAVLNKFAEMNAWASRGSHDERTRR